VELSRHKNKKKGGTIYKEIRRDTKRGGRQKVATGEGFCGRMGIRQVYRDGNSDEKWRGHRREELKRHSRKRPILMKQAPRNTSWGSKGINIS